MISFSRNWLHIFLVLDLKSYLLNFVFTSKKIGHFVITIVAKSIVI